VVRPTRTEAERRLLSRRRTESTVQGVPTNAAQLDENTGMPVPVTPAAISSSAAAMDGFQLQTDEDGSKIIGATGAPSRCQQPGRRASSSCWHTTWECKTALEKAKLTAQNCHTCPHQRGAGFLLQGGTHKMSMTQT